MPLSTMHKVLLAAYGTLWRAARPVLARNRRLREGYAQRLAPQGWASPADLWLQCASGGEAYLAWEMLRALPPTSALRLLLVTWTTQGKEVLEKAAAWAQSERPHLAIQVRMAPFDEPGVVARALDQTRPGAVVLLETELWPALLAACASRHIPVGVVNGRMTTRTLTGYLPLASFWRAVAPTRIAAMAHEDAMRFALLFGADRVQYMPNIKFDRSAPAIPPEADTQAASPPPDATSPQPGTAASHPATSPNPLLGTVLRHPATAHDRPVVLASVREEEEPLLLPVVQQLLARHPAMTLVVAPRHMHRIPAWCAMLDAASIPWVLRSQCNTPPPPATVILGDAFGELEHFYRAAGAVFVGGSLAPLGGQNFLEPLAHGVVPCVGPHLTNFAWVGGDLPAQGLLTVVPDAPALCSALSDMWDNPPDQTAIRQRFAAWMAPRRGGSAKAMHIALSLLGNSHYTR